ncbi:MULTISPECIES: hypothetical protein [Achromobacter]|uniref:Uncharacterized protein n=1 Tax=Achromobacter mucicolens TaxID=1389922 RepID=A0ABM8LKX1_9BURK|nr:MULTISPECIES: hypothetical protein [Achromobacter]AVG43925.1 hypothetical protein MC81_30940 [Achromobacter insolitus]CAB3845478.1 hypothetical protein LMG3410_01490 [Achromobacter aegrifaciens]CAB3914548.1 hypothetical protein LMG3415_05159 [Achromobacter mucicolens]
MSNHTGKAAPTKASNRIAYGELVGKISAGAPLPQDLGLGRECLTDVADFYSTAMQITALGGIVLSVVEREDLTIEVIFLCGKAARALKLATLEAEHDAD